MYEDSVLDSREPHVVILIGPLLRLFTHLPLIKADLIGCVFLLMVYCHWPELEPA